MTTRKRSHLNKLPTSLLIVLSDYLDADALYTCQNVLPIMDKVVKQYAIWQKKCGESFFGADEVKVNSPFDLVMNVDACKEAGCKMIETVVACSSEDRPDEGPENTLDESPCYGRLQSDSNNDDHRTLRTAITNALGHDVSQEGVVQSMCGCAFGRSCYWSSAASQSMESNDHIDYLIQEEAIINSVSVAPYRAFWHPQDPCYGPRAVAFRFGYFPKIKRGTHPSRDTIEFFYRSEEFPIDNEMKLQKFNMSKPVFCDGGVLRVEFIGKVQAQTVDSTHVDAELTGPLYYTCISRVVATGISCTLHEFER